MKALILAAGEGTRMPEFTTHTPKALVPVKGIPVLERILDALLKAGVLDVVITTGHHADQLEEFVASKKKYEKLKITFSFNQKFAGTNYITSMWTAKDLLKNEDVLLLHGDMVFDQSILDGILSSKTSAVCIRKGGELPEKDFKGRVRDGKVVEIGVDVWGDDAHACMPIYKVLSKDMEVWMNEIGAFIGAGDVKSYAEKAFNNVSDRITLMPHYHSKELCMEVDTMEDVRLAEQMLG